MQKLWPFVVAAFLLTLHPAGGSQQQITDLYQRGLAGDKAAVDQCIDQLEAALKAQPDNQLARVYLGSAYTLRSRDLGFGPKKLKALKHGLALMDQAVAAAPEEAKVRLARALTTQSIPPFFGRRKSTRQDFDLLVAMVKRVPAQLNDADLQVLYYNAGMSASEAGDKSRAITLWQEGLRYPEDSTLKEKAKAALARAQ